MTFRHAPLPLLSRSLHAALALAALALIIGSGLGADRVSRQRLAEVLAQPAPSVVHVTLPTVEVVGRREAQVTGGEPAPLVGLRKASASPAG